MQGLAMRPSVPLQGDGTNDTGSMIRHMTPRIGSEGNPGGDVEGGEADDLSNHNIHSRNVLRTSSMSPSSESPLRRTPSVQQNMVMYILQVIIVANVLFFLSKFMIFDTCCLLENFLVIEFLA